MKTIFITITRGFIIRNILRCGGLDLLIKSGYKIIIFFELKEMPEYLENELAVDDKVILIPIQTAGLGLWHRAVDKITNYLLFTSSTLRYLKYGNKRIIRRSLFATYAHIAFVFLISKIYFLKPLTRWMEINFFPEHNAVIKKYFDIYKPDLVFSTSIISRTDIVFLKEAQRRKITTVSMPKGWDNVTRNWYRFLSDQMIVQNEILKERMSTLQRLASDKIHVTGFPQFDLYVNKDIIRNKVEHFKKMGLNTNLPIIFFGSEGAWADRDYAIAGKIADWMEKNELSVPCQMLFRPHFTNIKEGQYKILAGRPNIVIDETINISEIFPDNWDPGLDEYIDFINSLYYSSLLITTASTLNLDAACLDKPAINLGFGCKFRNDEDITPWLYKSDHVKWLMDTNAVDIVWSEADLKNLINQYLLHPELKAAERKILIDKLCYKVDGQSSIRMVEAINNILELKN